MSATNKPKALLLDDDPTVLRLLGTALEARGFEVRAATDGESGVAVLLDELLDLDVLVADVDLPGRDARSLLHLVRRAGGERDLAIALLDGDGGRGVRDELLALGADAVIERGAGHAAAAAAIASLVQSAPARHSPAEAAPAPMHGALLVVRAALAPRLVPAAA